MEAQCVGQRKRLFCRGTAQKLLSVQFFIQNTDRRTIVIY